VGSARQRPQPTYRTTQKRNNHTQTSMPRVGFKHYPSIRTGEDGSCLRSRGRCDRQLSTYLSKPNEETKQPIAYLITSIFSKYFCCNESELNSLYFGQSRNRLLLAKQEQDIIWLCLEQVKSSRLFSYFCSFNGAVCKSDYIA
jgi:hypothetical protein